MVAIVAASGNRSPTHINQYKDTFANVLGITDTAQEALGRLVLPRATSNPPAVQGRMYYNTNENKPFFYNGSAWVPMGTLRSHSNTSLVTDVTVGTTMTQILSHTISTTGGGILAICRSAWQCVKDGNWGVIHFDAELRRSTTVLDYQLYGKFSMPSMQHFGSFWFCHWEPTIAPGTHSYNIRLRRNGTQSVNGSTHSTWMGTRILLMEFG